MSSAHSPTHAQISSNDPGDSGIPAVLDLRQMEGLASITSLLATKRVIYIGETHDNYGHHLAQLAVITALQQAGTDLAIGMEMFQRPYQKYLDEYIAGRLSESDMLRKTGWYDRWAYDYRYYRPILSFAKEHAIPVIALNVSREITGQVSKAGIDSLNEQARSQIPADIDYSDRDYTERLKAIYSQHVRDGSRSFERFLRVQLIWDEGMAERAADYLSEHPQKHLVVLAGSGHLMHGSGIPNRVKRRRSVSSVIVLPGGDLRVDPGIADFLIFPDAAELPPAALLGVYMEQADNGVLVSEVAKGSAAEHAGIKRNDIILSLDDEGVTTPSDLRIGLLKKHPGDSVRVTVLRSRLFFGNRRVDMNLILGP